MWSEMKLLRACLHDIKIIQKSGHNVSQSLSALCIFLYLLVVDEVLF